MGVTNVAGALSIQPPRVPLPLDLIEAPNPFPAQITGGDPEAGYTWKELLFHAATDHFIDLTGGRTDTLTGQYAWEIDSKAVANPWNVLMNQGIGDSGMPVYWFDVGDNTFKAIITGSPTQDGANFRWTYPFAQAEKSASGYGSSKWTAKMGGITGTMYNDLEAINGATGLFGNGVQFGDLVGTFAPQPIPAGYPFVVRPEMVVGGGGSIEYWFMGPTGITGACP